MIKKPFLIVALVAAAALGTPLARAQGGAVFCTNCPVVVQNAAETIGNAMGTAADRIGNAMGTAADRIVAAIQGASTAQTTSTSESAKMVSEANAKTAADMKKAEVQANFVPLDPCGVTAAAKGGGNAATSRPSGSGRGGSGAAPSAGATSEMAASLKISSNERAAPSPEIAADLAAKGACGTFAKGLRADSCRGAYPGSNTSVSSGYPNADIKAETIFDGPQNAAYIAAGVNRKLTISRGTDASGSPEQTAVAAFIRNLETPIDVRTLTAPELNSSAGRTFMALRDAYDANMSLATKPLRDQQSLLTANKTTIPILQQMMRSEDAKYVAAELQRVFPAWKTEGISYAQLISLETSRRYLNEDWHVRMAGANAQQLAAEQVQMQAQQGWMMAVLLERLQQVAIIQGAAAGASIRAEKTPLLIAAYKAARR